MKNKHVTILVIEDNPADFKLVSLMLKGTADPSFEVRHAERLDKALKMLEAEHFDVILMDLDLPDNQGLGGLKKVTEKADSTPVVMLTGLEDENVGMEAVRQQASDYLVKGQLTLNSLTRSIRYALVRHEAEQRLLNEQRNLQTVFDAVNVGMVLIDESGIVQRANNVITRWTGREPQETSGSQTGDIIGCTYALNNPSGCGQTAHCRICSIHKTFETVLNSAKPLHDVETEMVLSANGKTTHLYISVNADPVTINGKRHVILAMNNITDRKQAEELLRQSEERLKRAQEIARLGSWELDLARNRLTWSDETYRIFGLQPGEFAATYEAFLERVHPDDRAALEEAYSSSLRENRDTYEIEHRIICKSTGESRFVHEKCEHLRDAAGKIVRSVGMVHDITERKQAEEVLKRDKETFEKLVQERTEELWDAQSELARSKRLSDIGALAATVAHELRTPLGVIRIGAYNIKRKTTDPALLKHISHIEKKVAESDQIINNLLFYSRIKPPSLEEVCLYDLLEECVEVTKESFKDRKISILTELDSIKKETLKLDPLQIKEVFHNILVNAAEALDEHKDGQIKVCASRHDPKGEIIVTIEDNGVGISETDLEKIHEPFFTTKTQGTGLGLTVCFEIIQSHNGRIKVASQQGKGTVFTVFLPVGEAVTG